jgi:hypothetical protein
VVTPRVVAWFEKYVGNGGVVVRTSEKDRESVTWLEASQ